MDRVGVIDDLGGLLCEVKKYCGDDIFLVTDSRVLKEDMVNGQKIFVFFALDTHEKTLETEKMARMSRRSIQASNYIVYHNSNYSNKEIHRNNASNYSLFRINT